MQDGKNLKFEIDNTLMKVYLDRPFVGRGENTTLEIEFAYLIFSEKGGDKRRMKKNHGERYVQQINSVYEVAHYDGTHWYPRVCCI